jgi:hypothetical protein
MTMARPPLDCRSREGKNITAIIILVLVLIPVSSRSQAASNRLGVLSVIPWSNTPNSQIWSDSLTDGIVVREYWYNIETSPDVYSWNYLDKQFSNALGNNK